MDIRYNPFSLSGKTILITGASSGIGKAAAIECAKSGAMTILIGRNKEKLDDTDKTIKECSAPSPLLLYGDLGDADFIDSIISNIRNLKICGMVLCAGQTSILPVTFTSQEKIIEMMDVNFLSNVNLLQKSLKSKILKRGSSVVGVTSVLGIDGFMNGNTAYGVSKAAFESYLKYCALEFSARDIRFNSVHPGSVDTPMLNLSSVTKEQLDAETAKIPLKRMADPSEIAKPICFLLSDAASFITGSSLIIDGGQHLKF